MHCTPEQYQCKLKKYCDTSDNDDTKIDWQLPHGQWMLGWVDGINTNINSVDVSAMIHGTIERGTLGYSSTAPARTMSDRPGNRYKFVNILKRGYCNETCDVNLENFCVSTHDGRFGANLTNNGANDAWRCGWIDFDWTWNQAIKTKKLIYGVTYNENEQEKHQEKNHKKFREISENNKCEEILTETIMEENRKMNNKCLRW